MNKRLYGIFNSKETDSLNVARRIERLESACKANKVEFVLLDEENVDFTDLPIPNHLDGVYNFARGGRILESVMITTKVKSFYRNYSPLKNFQNTNLLSQLHSQNNIPVPKTIYKGTSNKDTLKKYVKYLEGFPIVIKTDGGTCGLGVIKVDNFSTLYSLIDYMESISGQYVLKQCIPAKSCERLIVIGNEVIAGVKKPNKENDFRSGSFSNIPMEYPLEICDLAVQSVHTAYLNMGGVDIIIDERNNKPYVLEVNMPLDFTISEEITGIDIAGRMIKWLFKR